MARKKENTMVDKDCSKSTVVQGIKSLPWQCSSSGTKKPNKNVLENTRANILVLAFISDFGLGHLGVGFYAECSCTLVLNT